MEELTYEYKNIDGEILSIRPLGVRATLNDATSFKDILFEEIDKGRRKIILVFDRVDFIDSSFMGAIVVSWKKLSALQGILVLTNLNMQIFNSFHMTLIDKSLNIAVTESEAIKILTNNRR